MELKSYIIRKLIIDADESAINDFIEANEAHIIDGINRLWDEHKQNIAAAKCDTVTNLCDLATLPCEDDCEAEKQPIADELTNELIDENSNDSALDKTKEPINDGGNMSIIPGKPQQEYDDKAKEAARNEALQKQINALHIRIQNGKVNQNYDIEFDIEKLNLPDCIGEIEFKGLDSIGLEYIADEKRIKGLPLQAGDHKIDLIIKPRNWQEGQHVFYRSITIIINPDPRSLWNNIPTPTSVPYYKPDSAQSFIDGIKKDKKSIVAASQRGRSHAHEGTPRDDDFSMFVDESTGWYIITVADGAGSAKYSRRGSQIACETVIEVCKTQLRLLDKSFDDEIKIFNKEKEKTPEKRRPIVDNLYNSVGAAAFKAYKNIEKESVSNNAPMRDYSTTLIITVCKKCKFGWFIGAFWIGDGGVGVYNKDTQYLKVLGEPDGGEFAGQTRFLTMSEVMQPAEIYRRLRFDIIDDFTGVVLMTDGITDPKFETDANLAKIEKWNALWDNLSADVNFEARNTQLADQLFKWLDFWSQGNHDDRTIAILY